MKKLSKLLYILFACVMILALLPGLNVFAEDNAIIVSGFNGNATCIERGTSMRMVASGVTQGKSVSWSVTALDGSQTDLATIEQTSALTGILTATANSYGTFKVIATQNDASGKKGEQTIHITNENLVTVDDSDGSIKYIGSGSAVWEEKSNSDYYLGTGKCVIPAEDDSYSSITPAYAEFTFTGTGIQWIGESNYFCGVAEVYLDGAKVSTVDPFIAPGVISQYINFSREGLPYGEHTIRIVAAGLKNPASTQYPGTRVLIDAFRYIAEAPPTVVLTGNDSVQTGSTFTVGISLNNIIQSVYAEDITLSYDPAVFSFETVTNAGDNVNILGHTSGDGTLRIVAANVDGISGSSTPIADVVFKVKDGISGISSTISVTVAKLGMMPKGTVLEAGLSSKTISVGAAGTVNKAGLGSALEAAQTKYNSAVVGVDNGCYWQVDKDILQSAITAANAVYEDPDASQAEVDNATAKLNTAVDTFDASAINPATGDIDNSGAINVADLAKVAYFYGVDSSSADWATAAIADINKDGKVDIVDLAFVAFRM